MSKKQYSIHISLSEKRLYLFAGTVLSDSWPVAIGKADTPTPAGRFIVNNKSILDGRQIYGTRWIGFSKPRYGIHGTNNPACIGKAVSKGCVRMRNKDVEALFAQITIGTPVYIALKPPNADIISQA
jgi:lipoprotein-anchoring transpeptidase ErfK/SrfK